MLKKIRSLITQLGWSNIGFYIIHLLLRRISTNAAIHKYILVAQPVPETPWLPTGRVPTIEMRMVSEAEYDFSWFPRPASIIQMRYRQGAVCLVAFKEGNAIGCLWLLLGSYMEDEVRCRFVPSPPGMTAWDFDVYLQPRYRFGRTFLYLWDTANAWLRERNIHWTMSRIDAFNQLSVRSHQRLGAQQIGTVLFTRFGTRQLMLANIRPYFYLSSDTNTLPEITIPAPKC